MRRMTMAMLTLALVLPGTAALAQERSWLCESPAAIDRGVTAELQARAANVGMMRMLEEYRKRWDAAEMRRQCDAFAAGEPYEIACLNGRRDWDAIEAMVPEEFYGMANSELRPHFLELQTADDGYGAAIDYCRSVGAIR